MILLRLVAGRTILHDEIQNKSCFFLLSKFDLSKYSTWRQLVKCDDEIVEKGLSNIKVSVHFIYIYLGK